mgnify:CR=1 FL=1
MGKKERFLAAVYAYTQNFGNLDGVARRTFVNPPLFPSGMKSTDFDKIIFAVGELIMRGDDLPVLRSCAMDEPAMRRELKLICDDAAWIDEMILHMPR